MLLWILFAALTAAATLAVIAPLSRRSTEPGSPAAGHDVAVYRDQLAELDRDREQGLIGPAEAEAARTEIARRVLKASAANVTGPQTRSWAKGIALASILFVPIVSLGVYVRLGSPDVPGQPLAPRLAAPADPSDLGDLIGRIEAHLLNNPNDANGWRVIAPTYQRLGRMGDAADAYRRLIELQGPDPQLQEAFGETLVAANQGMVTGEAQTALDAAVAADPDRIKARYYRALGLMQAGRHKEAVTEYDEITKRSAADAPWMATVAENRGKALAAAGLPADTPGPQPREPVGAPVAEGGSPAPGPSSADVAAAAEMSDADRQAMINGMVEQLAARLADAPQDSEGWQRLIRAYAVLDRKDDAKAAYDRARETFKDKPEVLAAIDGVARDVGIAN
ncbi:c-type cytochrome biogenesis protein CcmI [Chthonobacter albigriseus]|uniref:c-type cytochrome biogenesis protein CcmI n=1 Tax=Chthonobacter albigriseus TaxID=1683161 RepID=UPI0015EF5BB4|nr:c-type cytochrome biogenesis protein CcmI [Chthonobacter albigriseus]